jgi:hypothetical protein
MNEPRTIYITVTITREFRDTPVSEPETVRFERRFYEPTIKGFMDLCCDLIEDVSDRTALPRDK